MHGAGLANAVLAAPRANVVVELRSSFGAHLDIFALVAQVRWPAHIMQRSCLPISCSGAEPPPSCNRYQQLRPSSPRGRERIRGSLLGLLI